MNTFQVAEYKTIPIQGHDFLFLPADKAVFEIDKDLKDLIQRLDEIGPKGQEAILEALPGRPEDKEELMQDLVQRHILVPLSSVNPTVQACHRLPDNIPIKTLVLHVTDACNLACRYCYYLEDRADLRTDRAMTPSVIRHSIDFLLEHSGNLDRVTLVFFGGEPLLNFKRIRDAVNYAQKRSLAYGKEVEFSITTNGTLLNTENIDFLQDKAFTVSVSVDGFEEIHDTWRPFPDGSPSYRIIIPKVQRLLQKAPKPVVARATLVESPELVPAILEHLLQIGFTEVGFAPVTSGNSDYQLSREDMDTLLEQFQILAKRFVNHVQDQKFFGFSNLIDLLVSLHHNELKSYPCGAGIGLFAVDTQGNFYPCQRFTGYNDFCMGNVFQGLDSGKVNTFRQGTAIYQKKECRTCWVRSICAGGCYNEAYVREGSHLLPNIHYCEWIKKWTHIGLETYCQLALTCPEFLDMLSQSRGNSV
jgi:uncharacterized protein